MARVDLRVGGVIEAINEQINSELSASYSYLGMSAWCERQKFTGGNFENGNSSNALQHTGSGAGGTFEVTVLRGPGCARERG